MEGWKSCCGSGIHGAQSNGRQKMKKNEEKKLYERINKNYCRLVVWGRLYWRNDI